MEFPQVQRLEYRSEAHLLAAPVLPQRHRQSRTPYIEVELRDQSKR